MQNLHDERFTKVKSLMTVHGLDCIILCNSPNLYYLTSYSPKLDERLQVAFIPAHGEPIMVVPKLYSGNAEHECSIKDQRVWTDGDDIFGFVADIIRELNIQNSRIAIDESMRFMHVHPIQRGCLRAEFISADSIFKILRMKKDPYEISLMEESSKLSDELMEIAIQTCISNKSEGEIKNFIESEFLNRGMTDGFSNLIASGPNSSSPHHVSGSRIPQNGDSIYLDLGGAYKKYWSDITRTIHLGKPSNKFINAYMHVKEAQTLAKDAIRPGVIASDVHMTVLNYLSKHCLEEYFIHRTGHGVGLEGHEEPSLGIGNDLPLEEGMTFSVEPGVYFKNEFGIRIEDTVVVTRTGCRSLNYSSRELRVL